MKLTPYWLDQTQWVCPRHLPAARLPESQEKCWFGCGGIRPAVSLKPDPVVAAPTPQPVSPSPIRVLPQPVKVELIPLSKLKGTAQTKAPPPPVKRVPVKVEPAVVDTAPPKMPPRKQSLSEYKKAQKNRMIESVMQHFKEPAPPDPKSLAETFMRRWDALGGQPPEVDVEPPVQSTVVVTEVGFQEKDFAEARAQGPSDKDKRRGATFLTKCLLCGAPLWRRKKDVEQGVKTFCSQAHRAEYETKH